MMKRSTKLQLFFGGFLVLVGLGIMGWVFFTQDPREADITTMSLLALTPTAVGALIINIAFIRLGKPPG